MGAEVRESLGRGVVLNLAPKGKNYIIPDLTLPYEPLSVSREFFSWDNLVFGKEDNEPSKAHYMAMDMMLSPGKDSQLVCHRDFAKTTIFVKKLLMYIAFKGELPGFGKVTNTIIFSATRKQAIEILTSIKLIVDTNPILADVLKLAKKKNGRLVADKEDYVCYEMPNGEWIHIQAKGALESMRGTSKNTKDGKTVRPELLFFDDILTDDMLHSKVQRKKAIDWFFGVVLPAMRKGHNKRFMVGTPMTEDDLINVVKEGSTFRTLVIKLCQKFPAQQIVPAWPDKFKPEDIIRIYNEYKEAGKEDIFFREMMLEITPKSLRAFKDEHIVRYDYQKAKKTGLIEGTLKFASIDLAVTKFKTSARTAIITIGVTTDDKWYILSVNSGRFTPDEIFDRIFEQKIKYRFEKLKAEKVGIQYLFNYFFEKKQKEKKIHIDFDFLSNNSTVSKHTRIMALQPKMEKKEILFPYNCDTKEDEAGVEELIRTIKGYLITGPTTATVDDLDCLANFMDENFVYPPDPMYGMSSEVYDDDFEEILPYGE